MEVTKLISFIANVGSYSFLLYIGCTFVKIWHDGNKSNSKNNTKDDETK